MVRQCAWCLHLINSTGERQTSSPLPKIYEASHGICRVCGETWLAGAMDSYPTNQCEYEEQSLFFQLLAEATSRSEYLPDLPLRPEVIEDPDLKGQGIYDAQGPVDELLFKSQRKTRRRSVSRVTRNVNRLQTF